MARLQIPRAAAATIDSVALNEGELVNDTTNDNLRLGDGSTLGGKRLVAAAADLTVSAAMAPVVSAATLATSRSAYGLGTEDTVEFDVFDVGSTSLFGSFSRQKMQVSFNTGSTAPSAVIPTVVIATKSKGDNATAIGSTGLQINMIDRDDVDATNKGVLYGIHVRCSPAVARNNVPYDDIAGITIQNVSGVSGARGTDAYHLAASPAIGSGPAWYSGFTIEANTTRAIQIGGTVGEYGLDFNGATFTIGTAIRLKNNSYIRARDNAGSNDRDLIALNASDIMVLGGTGVASVRSAVGLLPLTTDGAALGSASVMWADLFLASGAVINFNAGNYTITHSSGQIATNGNLELSSATPKLLFTSSGSDFDVEASSNLLRVSCRGTTFCMDFGATSNVSHLTFTPISNDGAALGTTALSWSDLFLASGGVINFNNGTYTLTQASAVMTASGSFVAAELRASGDVGGAASQNSLTNVSDLTANSSGVGTILFKGATNRNSSGFIKTYIGTTAYYVPVFSAITG